MTSVPRDGTLLRITVKLLRLSEDLPIVIEIVDSDEKIRQFLPQLDSMIHDGLVTLEQLDVLLYRATPAATG